MLFRSGLSLLTKVLDEAAYSHLDTLGDRMRKGMRSILDRLDIPGLVMGIGSMATILFNRLERVTNYREAILSDQKIFEKYWFGCLNRGVMLMGPKWSEESMIMTAHNEKDIDEALNVIEDVLKVVARS